MFLQSHGGLHHCFLPALWMYACACQSHVNVYEKIYIKFIIHPGNQYWHMLTSAGGALQRSWGSTSSRNCKESNQIQLLQTCFNACTLMCDFSICCQWWVIGSVFFIPFLCLSVEGFSVLLDYSSIRSILWQ